MAAGMTLAEADLERFRVEFAAEIASRADPSALRGVVDSDGELRGAELSIETARVLRGAGPWGQDFPSRYSTDIHGSRSADPGGPAPQDAARAHAGRRRRSRGIDAIAFGHAGGDALDPSVRPGRRLQVAYRLEVNDYRGAESMQLNCQHILPA